MKKAMVLQDIKNTNSSDPDPPAPARRKKEKSRKAVTTDKAQDLDVSLTNSPAHNLNLPLLQRIQMALIKTKEDDVSAEEEKPEEQDGVQQLADSPAQVETVEDGPVHNDNPEKSTGEEAKDDILSSQSLHASVDVDNSTVATTSILEQTTANSSLDQAFCNISELEQSAIDSQSKVTASTSLLSSEQTQDHDTKPNVKASQVSTHSADESDDKHITSSTLVSSDVLTMAEESKADIKSPTVQTKITEQKSTPYVCVLSQLEEDENLSSTSSMDYMIGAPSGTKRDSSGMTLSSIAALSAEGNPVPKPEVSTPKDILDDLDLEVKDFVSGRESKRRKSSRRRSQQVFSLPVLTAEPSPEVVATCSQEEETRVTQDTTPSVCIINDKKRGARGRRKRPAVVTTTSPVEDWTTLSPADSPLSDQVTENSAPDTDGSDHSSHSGDRRSPATTAAAYVETSSTSTEVTDQAQIDAAVSDIITPPVCLIDDRNSRRRRKKSPVTAASPQDVCIPVPSEDVIQQPEDTAVSNITTPAVCLIDDRNSRRRRKKSPVTAASPQDECIPLPLEDVSLQPEGAVVSDITTPPACLIDDRNSQQHSHRKKSPVTAVSPQDNSITPPSEIVRQQPEAQNESGPTVCISSGRGSRGRRRKAAADSPTSDVSTSGSPEDIGHATQWEQNTDDASSVCLINDAPRGSHKKRRKRGGDTQSPDVPVQSASGEDCAPVSACTSKTAHPAETTTHGSPEVPVDEITPWSVPDTTPLRGEPTFSFTVIKEVKDEEDSVDLKRKVSKKRRRQADLGKGIVTEASSSVVPPEIVQQPELPVLEEDKHPVIYQEEAQASQSQQDELMLDDIDFGESFPTIEKPKRQQKRRRRSADFDISSKSLVESPNLEESLEGLNWLENQAPSRRSKRLRRKSLDIYRESITKAREDDEEKRRQSIQQELSMAEENQEVSESEQSQESVPEEEQGNPKDSPEKVTPLDQGTVPEISPESDVPTEDSTSGEEPRRSRRAPKVNLTAQLEETNAGSSTPPKVKRGKKSKKNEPSVEDIYLNKLWRTQMPKDKIWETIFEAPKSTKWGTQEYMSKMRLKRHVNFDDFYATNRLKKRRQKALKMGWKPLTEQKDMVAAANLEERIQSLDREISIIETKTLCSPEAGVTVIPTVCVRLASASPGEGEDDFYTPVQSASNLLQFGQLEEVESDLSASLSSADVSASPLQTFTTPMLESVGDKLKSFASCEFSTSRTQSDSPLKRLKVPKQKSLQPIDIIKQKWKRTNADAMSMSIATPNFNASSDGGTPDHDSSSLLSKSGSSWVGSMFKRELVSRAKPGIWDDTDPEEKSDIQEDDDDDQIPKKRRDTPYFPKFTSSRLDTATASYLCGTSMDQMGNQPDSLSEEPQGTKCKKVLLGSFSNSAAGSEQGQIRCSSCSCNDQKCDHKIFESNVSPIIFLKPPEDHRGVSGNTTGDDAVFTDDSPVNQHNLPLDSLEQDWGKRYSGEYNDVLPSSPVIAITAKHFGSPGINDPDSKRIGNVASALKESTEMSSVNEASNNTEEGSSNSMLDYVIQVSQQRSHQSKYRPNSETISAYEDSGEAGEDSVVDYFGKPDKVPTYLHSDTSMHGSISDIFAPVEGRSCKMASWQSGSDSLPYKTAVDSFQYSIGLDTNQESEAYSDVKFQHSTRRLLEAGVYSCKDSKEPDDSSGFGTIPLHYDDIIKAAMEDDSRCSDNSLAENDEDLKALLTAFNRRDCDPNLDERVDASVSDHEDSEPFRMLQSTAKNEHRNKADVSMDSNTTSPIYGSDTVYASGKDASNPKELSCPGEIHIINEQNKETCEARNLVVDYIDANPPLAKKQDVTEEDNFVTKDPVETNLSNSCDSHNIKILGQITRLETSKTGVLRTDRHYPSFSDSSQNTSGSFNLDSIIKQHLFSPDETGQQKATRHMDAMAQNGIEMESSHVMCSIPRLQGSSGEQSFSKEKGHNQDIEYDVVVQNEEAHICESRLPPTGDDILDDEGMSRHTHEKMLPSSQGQQSIDMLDNVQLESKNEDISDDTSPYSSSVQRVSEKGCIGALQDKKILLLDSPQITMSRQDDLRKYRLLQVKDYEYYHRGFDAEMATEGCKSVKVSWSMDCVACLEMNMESSLDAVEICQDCSLQEGRVPNVDSMADENPYVSADIDCSEIGGKEMDELHQNDGDVVNASTKNCNEVETKSVSSEEVPHIPSILNKDQCLSAVEASCHLEENEMDELSHVQNADIVQEHMTNSSEDEEEEGSTSAEDTKNMESMRSEFRYSLVDDPCTNDEENELDELHQRNEDIAQEHMTNSSEDEEGSALVVDEQDEERSCLSTDEASIGGIDLNGEGNNEPDQPTSPSSVSSDGSATEEKCNLSVQEKRQILQLDSPNISSLRKEDNKYYRMIQVADYEYYDGGYEEQENSDSHGSPSSESTCNSPPQSSVSNCSSPLSDGSIETSPGVFSGCSSSSLVATSSDDSSSNSSSTSGCSSPNQSEASVTLVQSYSPDPDERDDDSVETSSLSSSPGVFPGCSSSSLVATSSDDSPSNSSSISGCSSPNPLEASVTSVQTHSPDPDEKDDGSVETSTLSSSPGVFPGCSSSSLVATSSDDCSSNSSSSSSECSSPNPSEASITLVQSNSPDPDERDDDSLETSSLSSSPGIFPGCSSSSLVATSSDDCSSDRSSPSSGCPSPAPSEASITSSVESSISLAGSSSDSDQSDHNVPNLDPNHQSPAELRILLLDPPQISASQQEANIWFRQQQLCDYDFNKDKNSTHGECDREMLVSWSKRLVQLTLYDEDIWCDPFDTTVEDEDSGHWEQDCTKEEITC